MPPYPVILFALLLLAVLVQLGLRRRRRRERPREVEARALLRSELGAWRTRSYDELAELIGATGSHTIEGPRGIEYGVEVQVFWDDHPGGVLRVRGAIDDGGVRAFMPFCEDFLLRADGVIL